MNSSVAIELKDICVSINEQILFDNFNLIVDSGEKICFDGPSGSGKSTLFKMILGFKRPNSGSVFIQGNLLDSKNCQFLRKKCAYISQDVDLPAVSVHTFIERIFSFKANRHISPNKDKILHQLSHMKLNASILEKNIRDLSGGEKQRLSFCICILLKRPIWLLDEITTGLDDELKNLVEKEILSTKSTVIVISHDTDWKNKPMRHVRWSL